MRVPFVKLAPQNIAMRSHLMEVFERVLASGRYLMGPEVEAFEVAIALWHGLGHAVGVSNGSDACEIAIRACGWGDGQTVATPAFGCPPTISAIEAAGATPVLVDVDPLTCGVSFDTLAQVKTDGAVVVHMFGMPCDVPRNAVEDCAHAQGATLGGQLVGTIGRAGAISFFPTKCLGAMGDGGAIVTNDAELAARARAIRHYGSLLGVPGSDIEGRGQNSRISELSAGIVMAKLPNLHEWNRKRRELAFKYNHELRGRVKVPARTIEGRESVFHVYVIQSDERDRIKAGLEERGIGSQIHYAKPLHFYRRWRDLGAPGDFPVAEKLAATVLSLPMYPELGEDEQDAVIAAVKELT